MNMKNYPILHFKVKEQHFYCCSAKYIGGIMVRMLTSSVVSSSPGQINPITLKLKYVASSLSMQHL